MTRRFARAIAIVVTLLAITPAAHADGCDETRLASLNARLRDEAHHLRVWKWSWGLALSGTAVVQAALIPVFHTRSMDIDLISGVGASLVGLGSVTLFSPSVDEGELDPEAPICARIADAERRIALAGEAERAGRSVWLHVLDVGFNLGVGALLGFGYGHWASGVVKTVVGTAVGEAILFTQPTGLEPMPGLSVGISFKF